MAVDLGFDYEKCFVDNPSYKKSDIEELKQWIQSLDSSKNIPKDISDKQLLVFHNACDLVIEDTKKCIKAYYGVRDKTPEQFDDRDASSEVSMQCQETQEYIILPEKSDEGYTIMFHRLHDFSPERYNYNPGCKVFCMTIDADLYENGPQKGLIFLLDMKGVKLSHLTRVPLGGSAKHLQYVQEGMPYKIVAVHILNVVSYFDKIMAFVRPFLKGELIKKMVLHPPDMDLEKFYKEVLPKRCLPSDLGGDLPDTQTLNKLNTQKLIALKPYFDAEEKQRHVCSKNSKKKSNVERNFQDLNID